MLERVALIQVIHLTRSGIPSGALSIPTRYIHTPSEMASLTDIKLSVDLLVKMIERKS